MGALAQDAANLLREGLEQHRQGRLDGAARLYEQALEDNPSEADALHLLGVIAHQRGDHAAAVERIRRAIAIDAPHAHYHSNLGVAYRSLGRTAEAVTALRRAVALDPASPGVRLNLGNALKDASEFSEAAAEFRRVLEQDPRLADAWSSLGDALRGLESLGGLADYAEARRCHDRALELAPRSAEAHYGLGLTLRDDGQLSRSVECFLRAACLRPDFFDAHVNLANAYEDLALFPEALAAFDRTLRIKRDAPPIRFNRALALLRQGDLARGWQEYEWRWRHNGKPRIFSEPEWDAATDPTRTVLVYSEQGIGDEVMFASCFGEVIARSGRCLIECEPRLMRLFARSFPQATIFPRTGTIDPRAAGVPHWDVQIAAGSLPRVLRPRFDSFPVHAGYLVPDPQKVREWRERFERLGCGLTVGFAWRGGKDPATRRRRSTRLAQWAPLFRIPGVAFVNLQYGDCASELDQARRELGVNLYDWPDADPLGDLDGPAAQIAALDLVISVDNAAVHLAGALNVPVWTLLPFAGDWRWFTDRGDSPWYPCMRHFRQQSPQGSHEQRWDSVFGEVSGALAELARRRAAADFHRGTQLQDAGMLAEAIDAYRRSAALAPEDSRTLNNVGAAWKQGGRPDLAEAAYRAALAVEPHSSTVWFNLGNSHREENRLEEAVACYRQALEIAQSEGRQGHKVDGQQHPNRSCNEQSCDEAQKILVNLAVTLKDLHEFPAAVECLERVLADFPQLPAARFDRSLIWLAQGNLAAGWDEYEWRLKTESRALRANSCDADISWARRSVQILAEQGVGDHVMFASCLDEVARAARTCRVECEPRLVPLFARSFPSLEVVGNSAAIEGPDDGDRFDVTAFIGSLPRYFRRRFEDFPATTGFLKADPTRVASWRTRLSQRGTGLKVGIAWKGGKDRETQAKRAIPLEEWGPLFQVPGVRFFNLQHGPAAADAAVARNRFGVALDDGADCNPLADLDDFCAKLAALDLVISADNSTVHLAGALGRPVWTLLPFSADWRWMLQRETTPWYPSMRLLRCRSAGAWSDLMRRTARLLASAAFNT
jgi:tetratricopeptide (TPR) repeat protein